MSLIHIKNVACSKLPHPTKMLRREVHPQMCCFFQQNSTIVQITVQSKLPQKPSTMHSTVRCVKENHRKFCINNKYFHFITFCEKLQVFCKIFESALFLDLVFDCLSVRKSSMINDCKTSLYLWLWTIIFSPLQTIIVGTYHLASAEMKRKKAT